MTDEVMGNGLDMSRVTPEQLAFLAKQNPQALANGLRHFQESQQDAQPSGAQATDTTGYVQPPDQAPQGPLSQVAAQPVQQAQQPQQAQGQSNNGGALSSVMAMLSKPLPTVQEDLARYVPQDDSSQRYLAMAAAFGRPTGFGTLGETMSNVASALQQQKQNQDKLRLEYLPHIMQQVAAQQQMEIQRAQMLSKYAMMNEFMGGGQGGLSGQSQGAPQTGGPMGQSSGMPQGAVPQGQPQNAGGQGVASNGLNYPLNQMEMRADMAFNDGKGLPGMIAKRVEPSAFNQMLLQAGIDPRSPQGQALQQQNIEKAVNLPLQSGRAGAPMFDSKGNVVAMAPKIPENAIPDIQNGRVVGVSQLPGAPGVVAGNAALHAGGTEYGKAPFAVETLNTEGSPTVMTKQQIIEAATGKPMPVPGQPAQGVQQPGTVQQQPGQPPATPGLKLQDQGAGAEQRSYGTQRGQLMAEKPVATVAFNDAASNLDRLTDLAGQVAKHPGLSNATGLIGAFPNVPGSAASDATASLDSLKSQVAFSVLQAMRNASKTGGALGQVSDREEEMLANNLAALQRAQSTGAIREQLIKIAAWAPGAKARLKNAYDMTYNNTPAMPPAGADSVITHPNFPGFSVGK